MSRTFRFRECFDSVSKRLASSGLSKDTRKPEGVDSNQHPLLGPASSPSRCWLRPSQACTFAVAGSSQRCPPTRSTTATAASPPGAATRPRRPRPCYCSSSGSSCSSSEPT
jgi:hypothetical protein